MAINRITSDIIEALSASKPKTQAYDTEAQVVRVEGSTAWVHIPGGVDETPVALTINASEGDTVRVRVAGGAAWINGNATAPPTDDTRANVANTNALNAIIHADSAKVSAMTAAEAAEAAQGSAAVAYSAALEAQESANDAQDSARNANESATAALASLSTVQSVSETLAWVTQHGTMAHTSDVDIDPTHVYFVVDPTGDYVVGNTHYSIVAEPKASELSTYYELTIDESLNNYVATHLSVTNEGLWVLPASTGFKVLVATGNGSVYQQAGTYIIDGYGSVVARFGASVVIGKSTSENITIESNAIKLNAVDGSEALRIQFEPSSYGSDRVYGVRITNSHNSSMVSITPAVDSSGFTGDLDLIAYLDYMSLSTNDGAYLRLDSGYFVAGEANGGSLLLDNRYFSMYSQTKGNVFRVDWDGCVYVKLDTTAASTTKDGALYAAIAALGWQNEVIVND